MIPKENILTNILNNEENEYLDFIEELGYLPKYYYDSKSMDLNCFKTYILIFAGEYCFFIEIDE